MKSSPFSGTVASRTVLCMVAVALSSCSGMTGTTTPDTDQMASNAPIYEESATTPPLDRIDTDGSTIESASAQTLLSRGNGATIGIDFIEQGASNTIVIETGSAKPAYKVSRLESPSRLVVDVNDASVASTKTLTPPNQGLVSSVRAGSHDGKGRIVLDLSQPVDDSVTELGGKIVVSLAPKAGAATQVARIQEPAIEAIDNAITEQAPRQALISGPRVTGLSIENIPGQGNVVVADISSLKNFEFKKTAPSEYAASFRGASIDPVAAQTILAAPNSGAIRSVRPIERDGDVILRVFAQPEAELSAAATGGRLVIRSSAAGADFMAQEKVEPQLPAETVKDTTIAASPAKKVEESKSPVITAVGNDDLSSLLGGDQKYSGRLISLDLQDTDIDNALRIIAEVSNLNIIASSDVSGKITLRLIDVPWDQALDVILKTNGLDKVQEGNVVRIAPVEKLRLEREALKQAQLAEEELEPLSVKYFRVSYARAADLQPLVKSVLSERGDVSVDERSNQLIIKDIRKGVKNGIDLVTKLDLRTPQVLLETQIVEASRSLLRDLGAQLGFSFVQSPETGNATGYNFPNSIAIGGGIPGSTSASAFPAAITGTEGSAISMIFGSADGTRSLDANISALEKEGRIRIVSRPSVATTNNKAAEITSNETISVKKPSGGSNTVVGGNGGIGGQDTATEKIKAGITLKVTPQASPDYYVLMDIEAESSTFGSQQVEGIPSVFERKATSTVLVSSGQTFAIGGIYRLTDRDTDSGVPFLKDVPVLGHFFSRTLVNNSDEELLFFITPRIIEGSFDDAAMTANVSS